MWRCLDCGETFYETGIKAEKERYEYWGAPFTHEYHYKCCPFCGSEEFEEGEEENE